jgi:DnaK suppressor protein
MNKVQLKKFKTLLTEKRDEIVKKAKQTLEEDMTLDANDLPDEMDLASSEYLQSFTFRLRGREKVFLDKIEKALRKIEEGSFGVCEECGEEISIKRLEARPETTLCIRS